MPTLPALSVDLANYGPMSQTMRLVGVDDLTLAKALLLRGLALATGIDDAAASQLVDRTLADGVRRAKAAVMPPAML